jgi:hypothetical protein
MTGSSAAGVFVVVAIIIIVLILAFIVYRMRRSNLSAVSIVKNPKRLYDMGGPYSVDSARMPATLNGQEYSFTMWLYITDFTTTAEHKLILMRGGNGPTLDGASPIVFLDKNTNKLYISIRTNQSPTSVPSLDTVLNKASKYLTAAIEYVPLQRWVSIAFVVHDNLLTVYLNGDIYTVENVYDIAASGTRPVFSGLKGNVLVGSIANSGTNRTASTQGFISRTYFYNYALTPEDIRAVTGSGPVPGSSLLANIGMSEYGVRAPIYRVGEDGNPVDDS